MTGSTEPQQLGRSYRVRYNVEVEPDALCGVFHRVVRCDAKVSPHSVARVEEVQPSHSLVYLSNKEGVVWNGLPTGTLVNSLKRSQIELTMSGSVMLRRGSTRVEISGSGDEGG